MLRGDCLELMPGIPEGSVDLVLCDLPYGVTDCEWDKALPFDRLWGQYRRLLRPNGAAVLFGTEPFMSKLIQSNQKEYSHQWYWQKNNKTGGLLARRQPMRCVEEIAVFVLNKPRGNNEGRFQELHPTQKPLELVEYLVKTYSNPGDTVLDNCMGSGTTGVACTNTGRNFIGMELDGHYFEVAEKRIGEALAV